jgi:hypothetical protein
LSALFRRLFLQRLQAAFDGGKLVFFNTLAGLADPQSFARHVRKLGAIDWVVFAKPPFAGPEQVLAYLGRYTHRVAISNNRLISLENGNVSFGWRDYRQDAANKVMTLPAEEFIRRFLLHTLPSGFQRIRQYGLLANRHRRDKLVLCRTLLATPPPPAAPVLDYRQRYQKLTGRSLDLCPHCGGRMELIAYLPRGDPFWCDSS